VGRSRRIRVFQLAGNIHYFDSDQFFSLIIEHDQIVNVALAASRLRFLFQANVERVDIVLIIQPQFTRRELDAPMRSFKQFFFAGIPLGSLCAIRSLFYSSSSL
jgi:hypothetical protein